VEHSESVENSKKSIIGYITLDNNSVKFLYLCASVMLKHWEFSIINHLKWLHSDDNIFSATKPKKKREAAVPLSGGGAGSHLTECGLG